MLWGGGGSVRLTLLNITADKPHQTWRLVNHGGLGTSRRIQRDDLILDLDLGVIDLRLDLSTSLQHTNFIRIKLDVSGERLRAAVPVFLVPTPGKIHHPQGNMCSMSWSGKLTRSVL